MDLVSLLLILMAMISQIINQYRCEGFHSLDDVEAVKLNMKSGYDGRTMFFNVIGNDFAYV